MENRQFFPKVCYTKDCQMSIDVSLRCRQHNRPHRTVRKPIRGVHELHEHLVRLPAESGRAVSYDNRQRGTQLAAQDHQQSGVADSGAGGGNSQAEGWQETGEGERRACRA